MSELKPCPFCGGEAKVFAKSHFSSGVNRGWEFGICCTSCDITTPKTNYKIEVKLDGNGNIISTIDEREEAIKAWNRRTNDESTSETEPDRKGK